MTPGFEWRQDGHLGPVPTSEVPAPARLVVIGDLLLDTDVDGRAERLCPDAPAPVLDVDATRHRPGGAGLAAVLAAAGDTASPDPPAPVAVTLVSALGPDGPGRRLRELLDGCVGLLAGPAVGGTAVKTRLRASGRVLLRADHGLGRAAPGFGDAVRPDLDAVLGAGDAGPCHAGGAVLVSDYGRGVAADPLVRRRVAAAARRGVPVVWDPHPRGGAPVPGVAVVTPNLGEACAALDVPAPDTLEAILAVAAELRRRWSVAAVVVTLGADGAAVHDGAHGLLVPAAAAPDGDPCGAGDRFAGRVAGALAAGAPLVRAVELGVAAASRFVATGGAGAVRRTRRGWCAPAVVSAARAG